MKTHRLSIFSTVLVTVSLLACACTKGPTAPTVSAAGKDAAEPKADTVVATVGDQKITLAELDDHVGAQLRELDEQRYQARRQGLDQMVNQQLVKVEAAKKGISDEQYLKDEVDAKVTAPTDQAVAAFFAQNSSQLPPKAKIEDYRERIVTFMTRQAHSERAKEVFGDLRKSAKVEVSLSPPAKPRFNVEAKGPSRGPEGAKVTLVEFSDFECPFCSRGRDTVDKVMQKYEGKVRLVFRQFPLAFHKQARKAAEAALCANAQSKFWPMHDALFSDQSKLEPAQLKETAIKLGLDKDKFNACLDKGEMAKVIDEDMAAAEKVGVSGTPAFFINGVMLSGAQPVDEFERVIDAELAAK
jgi:protein-disulfide isomerase